jgi:hypothetical protein
MKIFMDEVFREIKIRGHLEELKELPDVLSRIRRLNEILIAINISKEPLSFYPPDEQLYLCYLLQREGVDMRICQHFYIFFSGKWKRFHHYCCHPNLTEKQRTDCRGQIKNCTLKKLAKE